MLKGKKTLLVNGGMVVMAALLQYVAGVDLTQYGLNAQTAAIIMGVVNIGLRFVTTTPALTK